MELFICPSILAADFGCLRTQCETVLSAGAQMLHFDVMDGHFVPNISFGVPVLKSLHRDLPDAFWDVHLMISDPLRYVPVFAKAGASLIDFHLESESDPVATLAAIRAAGCQTGMAIKPATPATALEPYLPQLDLVLVMTVEPGFGGQSFMADMLQKTRWLADWRKKNGGHYRIEVDGGINAVTAAACAANGVDILVAGSTVFAAPDPAAAVRELLKTGRA